MRFTAMYGYLWRNQYKSERFVAFAKSEWAEGLKPFSIKLIELAVDECRDSCEMPPALPQLIKTAKQLKRRSTVYRADEQPKNEADPKVVEAHLNTIKQIVK